MVFIITRIEKIVMCALFLSREEVRIVNSLIVCRPINKQYTENKCL